jgi:dihydrofolate reductase
MRKLMMKMSISVDGFVGAANGEIDWIFSTTDEAATAWIVGLCRESGLHIMGSKTFQDMACYWPTATDAFSAPMNEIPKALFTQKGFGGFDPAHTTTAVKNVRKYNAARGILPSADASPAAVSWAEARVFEGDLAEGIRQLKEEQGKPILAHGGAGFMRSLIATGLIDEYHLLVHPAALGAGMPIFNGLSKPLDLKLVDVKVFPGGAVAHTYHPA